MLRHYFTSRINAGDVGVVDDDDDDDDDIDSFIDSFNHSFITEIYIAPLQGYYSEAPPTLARLKRRVLRLE